MLFILRKKKHIIYLIIIPAFILIILFSYFFINKGERLNITYVTTAKSNIQFGEIPGNWFMITHKEQYDNWVKKGLELPDVDFNRNYLIISKVKINKLYKSKYINEDCGVHDGIALYSIFGSQQHLYYIYKMDKIILSQGIG